MNMSESCDNCGSHRMNSPCARCGAPICCEMCCQEDWLTRERDAALARVEKWRAEAKSFRNAFTIAEDEREHCQDILSEIEGKYGIALAEVANLLDIIKTAGEYIDDHTRPDVTGERDSIAIRIQMALARNAHNDT